MTTSTKPILNLITSTTDQINLNTFGYSPEDHSLISIIQSFLSSNTQFKGLHHSISLPTQDPSELYHLLDRLLSLIQSLTNQLQTSSLAQLELSSHLKISQSNLILAQSTVYDLEKVIQKLQQPQPSPTTSTNNQSKRRDRVDSEPDVGIYGRLNLFRFGRRSTFTNIKPTSSSPPSPSPLSSPLNLSSSSSSSLINCSSASSQSSFTSISSINSSNLNEIEKLKYETNQLKRQNQSLRSSLENVNESKRQIEGELEKLSIELFEEANRMVRDERMKFVELENELNQLKNQIGKPIDHETREFEESKNSMDSNHTLASCTVTPKKKKPSMIKTPERTFDESKINNSKLNSPETMNFISPRLSNRFSKLIKPINNDTISNSNCEVEQTYSPEADLDLTEWYQDHNKERGTSQSDVDEEGSREDEGMKMKEPGKEELSRSNSRVSYSSTTSSRGIEEHPKNVEKRFSSSSISTERSGLPSSPELETKSRPNSNLSLKPLLLNSNTPILSRLQTDSSSFSPKRHSSLNYHFHPRIRSPLSNQISKRSSSFNIISSSSSSNPSINDLSHGNGNRSRDEIKRKDYTINQRNHDAFSQRGDTSLDDPADHHLDLDSLLASIVDCAESLGFQDELKGILH
ncbi:uncharacterized protein MELLADRAFT_95444 [Melampsora larici-populina 98AG31]|uniref:GDP/GTP exchange factor Sec2 N-terminal domain-containing protein n=1 Tax=Melampsora larici-populina (strain 98AG31 / pathotype 3-4-7) TaxID=747676 RepID=F4S9C2_MELLP|nr:uncharacterized protein MELLADRAFT_95444 [Melampsora larici-populina 98AG31]EGF98757.1 hypothetical protein MELLADRAFT_95444 [Melampsora larici-populina 98AG31]